MLGVEVEHRVFPHATLVDYLSAMPMDSCAHIRSDVACVKTFLSDCLKRDPSRRPEIETLMQYQLLFPSADADIQLLLDKRNKEKEMDARGSSFSMISVCGADSMH